MLHVHKVLSDAYTKGQFLLLFLKTMCAVKTGRRQAKREEGTGGRGLQEAHRENESGAVAGFYTNVNVASIEKTNIVMRAFVVSKICQRAVYGFW